MDYEKPTPQRLRRLHSPVCSEFAHPHPELYDLNNEKGQNALTFLYKKGRRAEKLFRYNKIEELVRLVQVRSLAYLPN